MLRSKSKSTNVLIPSVCQSGKRKHSLKSSYTPINTLIFAATSQLFSLFVKHPFSSNENCYVYGLKWHIEMRTRTKCTVYCLNTKQNSINHKLNSAYKVQ